jgi:carbamoyltransferase
MRTLGLVCKTHDTGVALVEDGNILNILEEERHSREKHTQVFPAHTLRLLLGDDGAGLAGIDQITTPWDGARLKRTFATVFFRRFPATLSFVHPRSQTTQDPDIAFINFWLKRGLKRTFPGQRLPPIINVGHHESHAAMFFVSPFDEATVVVLDGYGDDAAASVFTGQGNKLERHWHGRFLDSLGVVYTLVTMHLGFAPFEEGTVMALAALGRDRLVEKMRDIVRLEPDGRFSVNMNYFSYDSFGMLRPFKRKFIETFGPARRRGDLLEAHHQDLAFALQTVCEEVVLHVVKAARQRHPSRNLCLVGGVALNCVSNARLLRDSGFDRVWVPPCASDTGAPLGSTLWHQHQTLDMPRRTTMTHAYYGQGYDDRQIEAALQSAGLTFQRFDDAELIAKVAAELASGRIVGWFQDRYEIGPRALGNRSILASPIFPEVRDIINKRVKFREPFRPFAPSVLEEHAADWFEIAQPDPFMTMAPRLRPGMAARIPAAVHVDGTARIQTVSRASNPRYHALIDAFRTLTGVPILLNTSFNKQEPIVARPEEAISCFLRTDMDTLVLGNYYTTDRPEAAVHSARSSFAVVEVNTRSGE